MRWVTRRKSTALIFGLQSTISEAAIVFAQGARWKPRTPEPDAIRAARFLSRVDSTWWLRGPGRLALVAVTPANHGELRLRQWPDVPAVKKPIP